MRALGVVLLSLFALACNVFAWLHSPWGVTRLEALAERFLADEFQGSVRVGSLRPLGLVGVRIRHGLVEGPTGHTAIAAERIDVRLRPLALLTGRMVARVRVVGARVEVADSPTGEDVVIGEAWEPDEEGIDEEKKKGTRRPLPPDPPLPLILEELVVDGAAFRLAEAPLGEPLALVREIEIRSRGAWRDGRAWDRMELTGRVHEPLNAPLVAYGEAAFEQDWLDALRIEVQIGDSRLSARGRGEMRALQARILFGVDVEPADARALQVPLARPLHLDGEIWLGRDRTAASLRAFTDGGGLLVIDSGFFPPTGEVWGQAVLAGIDPSRWLLELPEGAVSGLVRAEGSLRGEPSLQLRFSLPPSSLAGSTVGPGELRGEVRGESLDLESLRLTLPGAQLALRGELKAKSMSADGRVEASDLGRLQTFARRLFDLQLPPLRGRGVLDFRTDGTIEAPLAEFTLRAPSLQVGDVSLQGADLRGSVAFRPGELPQGGIEGSASSFEAGRLFGRELRFRARRGEEGRVELDVRSRMAVPGTDRLFPSELRLRGSLQEELAELDELRMRLPEGELRSEGRARLRLDEEGIAIEGLRLRQGDGGELSVDGRLRSGRLQASVRARDLRLDRLPQSILPWPIAGRLQVEGEVGGTAAAPRGALRFSLRDGAIDELRDVAGDGRLRFFGGRVAGEVQLAVGGLGLVEADLDIPLRPLEARGPERIDFDIRAGPIYLSAIAHHLDAELPEGIAAVRLRGEGTIADPELRLELLASRLRYVGAELPSFDVAVVGELQRGLARATISGYADRIRTLELEAATRLDAERLRRDPSRELRRMLDSPESRALGVVRGLQLAWFGSLLDLSPLRGAIAGDFDLRGPIADPRGQLHAELIGGPFGPARRATLGLEAELGEASSRLLATLTADDQPPARLLVEVGAPPRAFFEGLAPADTPVLLALDLPALELGALGRRRPTRKMRRESSRRFEALLSPGALQGRVEASLRFEGTLGKLPGRARLVAENLSLHDVPLGDVELRLEQGEDLVARLWAIDSDAGTLVGEAYVEGSVSPASLLQDGAAPLLRRQARVALRGEALSLRPLAILPVFGSATGGVHLRVAAQGPLGTLDPTGEIRLDDGKLELAGGPRYQQIRLYATLTGDRVAIEELSARAPGRGRLDATGELRRVKGPDPLEVRVSASSFPVGGPGGVAARVSAEGRLEGTVGRESGLDADLAIASGRIELPQTPPRTLQSVSRPKDVRVVTGPEARRTRRRALAAEEERAFPLRLGVVAERRIFVSGEDASAELAIDMTVRRTARGELIGAGSVRTIRGRVRALGRGFAIEEAAARWGGGPLENPLLSVTARYDAPQVTAWIDIAGTAEEPVVGLRSEPPMPESQIALLIASGRTVLPRQTPLAEEPAAAETDVAGAAVSVAGGWAAQKLRQAVGPMLPLDVLTLETGAEGTRIEAGTYVSDRLYLGYQRNFLPDEGENLNEVRADYELSRSVSIESRAGDRASAGVDLVWEKSIATPRQQRERREARREWAERRREIEQGEDVPAAREEPPPDPQPTDER